MTRPMHGRLHLWHVGTLVVESVFKRLFASGFGSN